MIDLKKWRDTNVEKKSLELGLINKSRLADQAILNYLFRGDVGFLDPEWNWQSPNVLLDGRVRIANYHFIWVKKPWMHLRTTLNYRLWRYYYNKYAIGEMGSLYRKIGLKRLIIGIRESLIRSSPFLRYLYLKSVALKLGVASPRYSGIRDYYHEITTAFPLNIEKRAFTAFVHLKNISF
jgi:lipopolysaccharide biosynthesis glycosyltransferase